MATKYSTGARNALGGKGHDLAFRSTGVSFVAGTRTIADSNNGFSVKQKPGDKIVILGSVSNDGTYIIESVVGVGSIVVTTALVNESAGAAIVVVGFSAGGSFTEVFKDCVGAFYSLGQPNDPNGAETGTLLGYLTVDGVEFNPGSPTGGLNFEDTVNGECKKPSGVVWRCMPVAAGTAGYLRVYDNKRVTGASSTAIRFDVTVGVGTGELRLGTNVFAVGVPVDVSDFTGEVPERPVVG